MVNRVSNDQLDELLEFLAEHPALARGVGLGSRSKDTVERQWNDLARKLNSFGSGSSKSGDRWKKYWADIKHKSKTRLAKRRLDARSKGGGPSTQEDLSDIDKKILAIIGEHAVYSDSQHELPIFYIQPEVQDTATVQPNYFVVSEEVVISDTSEFPDPVAGSVKVETQQVPELHQTGLENPVRQPRPARSRRRLKHNRPSLNSISNSILPKRIDREWVKELERNRLRAENKMADATLMIAEAANKMAEASLINAETNRMNAETNRMNAETNRKQLEVMKAIMDSVHQRTTGVSETAVLHILKEKEGRNAEKPQEPPEKRQRARKRSRQTDSSSEADSSDDNDGDNEQSSNYHDEEPEIEVGPAAVKIEPSDIEVNKEQAQTDPISLEVKTEPRVREMDNTNETMSLNEPAGTTRKGTKTPRRSDVTSRACNTAIPLPQILRNSRIFSIPQKRNYRCEFRGSENEPRDGISPTRDVDVGTRDVVNGVEFKDFKSGNIVWKHFLRSIDRQSAKCKLCPMIIKTCGRSTSGLHTHLRTKHSTNERRS